MAAIQLSGECIIYEIVQLHQKIHNNWHDETDLLLDVSSVTEVDASFIQLLAACKSTAEGNNQSFQLINPAESIKNKIKALYMYEFFKEEIV